MQCSPVDLHHARAPEPSRSRVARREAPAQPGPACASTSVAETRPTATGAPRERVDRCALRIESPTRCLSRVKLWQEQQRPAGATDARGRRASRKHPPRRGFSRASWTGNFQPLPSCYRLAAVPGQRASFSPTALPHTLSSARVGRPRIASRFPTSGGRGRGTGEGEAGEGASCLCSSQHRSRPTSGTELGDERRSRTLELAASVLEPPVVCGTRA